MEVAASCSQKGAVVTGHPEDEQFSQTTGTAEYQHTAGTMVDSNVMWLATQKPVTSQELPVLVQGWPADKSQAKRK